MSTYLDDRLIEDVKKELKEAWFKAALFSLLEKLDDEGRQEYAKIITEENTSQKLEEFFKSKISDYDMVLEKTRESFVGV